VFRIPPRLRSVGFFRPPLPPVFNGFSLVNFCPAAPSPRRISPIPYRGKETEASGSSRVYRRRPFPSISGNDAAETEVPAGRVALWLRISRQAEGWPLGWRGRTEGEEIGVPPSEGEETEVLLPDRFHRPREHVHLPPLQFLTDRILSVLSSHSVVAVRPSVMQSRITRGRCPGGVSRMTMKVLFLSRQLCLREANLPMS
jgi:hypothetical protein